MKKEPTQDPPYVVKRCGVDFRNKSGALTLNYRAVTDSLSNGEHTKTHSSGWTITGKVHEDYYRWVNDFKAFHPSFGWVEGDFEDEVKASSNEAFEHFWTHHEPEEWDYGDI